MSDPSAGRPSAPLGVSGELNRPTIGFFVPTVTIGTHLSLCLGALDAAVEAGANLIICPGQTLGAPEETESLIADIFYELVGKKCFDGIAAWTSGIGMTIGFEAARHFFERYLPLPMVSLGMSMREIPSIMLDNYSGIRQIIQHLVEVHGCRRLAFIHGQAEHIDDIERYQAYCEVLREYQLPLDPDLVTPDGTWFRATGEQAIRTLMDDRQTPFDGIVAANDWLAVGAIAELERRGVQVPCDVAVTGFADAPESRVGLPAITTVSSRFYDRGWQSIKLLAAAMGGESVAVETRIPVQLIVRQSCGCQLPSVKLAASPDRTQGVDITSPAGRAALGAAMAAVLGSEEPVLASASQWIDTLAAVIAGQEPPEAFLHAVDRTLRQRMPAGFSHLRWQDAISLLRRGVAGTLAGEKLHLAEDLWHQALVMIAQAQALTREAELMRVDVQAQPVRELAQRLITTFETDTLIEILADSLPQLGIASCYLALYENPQKSTEWARLVLAYNKNGRIPLPAAGLRFPTQELIPCGLWPREGQYGCIAEQLHFQRQPLGFVLFEVGPRDGSVYELLRREISSALQGAILVQRVQKNSADLARQHYILDTLLENIPDLVYFKDLESCFTRINKTCAAWLGLASPAEALGKSDFDFFPEGPARQKRELEQQIIITGQPFLRLEEEDGEGRWVETTKLPLRDEKGQVIGTFGLSRDISDIKNAHLALERAYNEVEKQVAQRTAELSQEISVRQQAEDEQKRLIAQLEAQKAELEQFTYMVSHDLKAPLITIRGFLGYIEKNAQSGDLEQLRIDLSRISDATDKMQRLLNELLELSRIGRITNPPVAVPFDAILQEALELVAGRVEARGVKIEASPGLPVVYVDLLRLTEVLQNLVDNACKFMGAQTNPRIQIGCQGQDSDGQHILYVRDNGMGIDPRYHGQVFGLFNKLDAHTEGTGVGLALVKRIIEFHGGRIWLESQGAGQGTTFYFTLPAPPV